MLTLTAMWVGACSGDDDDAGSSRVSGELESGSAVADSGGEAGGDQDLAATADAAEAEEAAEPAEAPAEAEPIGTGGTDVGALQPQDIGRDIVFTARISVAVDDVVIAGQDALRIVESLGGLLFGQETTVDDVPRTVLTFKVAPEAFQTAVTRLGDVGVLTEQVITADDVTERVVDLESRIITARSSVARLRGFLEQATELETVASLEAELLRRETDLELLRGQLRTLEGQVDLATITVELRQKRPAPAMSVDVTWIEGSDATRTSCRGDDDLEVDEGTEVTVCVEVVNEGDTPLADLEVRLGALDLDVEDLTVVSGDPASFAPAEAVVLTAQFEAGPSLFVPATATARAVDAEGVDLGLGTVEAGDDAGLDVSQEITLPGVGDALSTGWGALAFAANVVVIGLAVALPFLWIPLAVWLGIRWRRRPSGRTNTLSRSGSGVQPDDETIPRS